jgi:transcriptional regulator of acetoin/glycerol metabolism
MYRQGPASEALQRALAAELKLVDGDVLRAAKRWGCSESTMRRHLRRLGLKEYAARLRRAARTQTSNAA